MLLCQAGGREWRVRLVRCWGWCSRGDAFQDVEDDAGEVALEAAERFAAAFALGLLALQIGTGGRMRPRLRDRDPVEGAVELAVAFAVEPVTLPLA
jgi:hypothetical protein